MRPWKYILDVLNVFQTKHPLKISLSFLRCFYTLDYTVHSNKWKDLSVFYSDAQGWNSFRNAYSGRIGLGAKRTYSAASHVAEGSRAGRQTSSGSVWHTVKSIHSAGFYCNSPSAKRIREGNKCSWKLNVYQKKDKWNKQRTEWVGNEDGHTDLFSSVILSIHLTTH